MLPGAALLILASMFATDRGASVLVHDADGRTIVRAALPDSGLFGIEYVHSYYEVPATEHFVAEEDGSFELVEISSPSEAVLDYYQLEGRKEDREDLFSLAPDSPQRFDKLPLIGTEKGERILVVSGERFPLYEENGPRHITIRVEADTPLTEAWRMLTRSIG
jgi:hypothetical protein